MRIMLIMCGIAMLGRADTTDTVVNFDLTGTVTLAESGLGQPIMLSDPSVTGEFQLDQTTGQVLSGSAEFPEGLEFLLLNQGGTITGVQTSDCGFCTVEFDNYPGQPTEETGTLSLNMILIVPDRIGGTTSLVGYTGGTISPGSAVDITFSREDAGGTVFMFTGTVVDPTAVPEPGEWAGLGIGLVFIGKRIYETNRKLNQD